MGERKVLNKYIPADFDPSLVPKGKKLSSKDGTVPVRMMLPFSVQCSTCHTFLYRGRKFNSKKEPMGGGASGKYLGITRWRFYIKCTHCSRPLTFLTDPKNADYEMESGGQRNYEMLKDKAATEQGAAEDLDEEEKIDPMKALENRVLESQQEMADLDNLEEIKAMNARHVKLLTAAAGKGTNDQIISGKTEHGDEKDEIQLTAEDEALVQSIQFGKNAVAVGQIQRLTQDDERRVDEERNRIADELAERQRQLETVASSSLHKARPMIPIILKKKRRRTDDNDIGNKKPASSSATAPAAAPQATTMSAAAGGLASLLGGYGSNSSDD